MDEKANLMGQNQGHRNPIGTYRDIDRMKGLKQLVCGGIKYTYPGELIESDHDVNGGDLEDNISEK